MKPESSESASEKSSESQEESGGRSRTRTYDLAHVRQVDIKANLLDLLTEILLGASAGDDPQP
jgi:hypothetical protein